LFFIFFPVFLYELLINEYPYTTEDIIIAIASMILITTAIMCMGRGISYGNAGPV